MSGYRVVLTQEARGDLDRLTREELAFLLEHIEALAAHPSALSEPAGPLTSPGGMCSKASMPTGGDATYFLVLFRYSADETSLVILAVDVARPPSVEDEA